MAATEDTKTSKKLAKARAKAAKKRLEGGRVPAVDGEGPRDGVPSEGTVERAEKELALTRWKVIFAGLSVLIALVSLIVMLLRT